jgi:hypothetical protein
MSEPAPRRGLPAAFWVMIGFGFVCIAAGVVVGLWGPALFPVKHPAPATAPQLGKPPPSR